MKSKLKVIGRLSAVLASLFCITAGGMIIKVAGFGRGPANDNMVVIAMGVGLYFIGKGFFIGPMLWLATEQICRGR
jgi:hypothetical protein